MSLLALGSIFAERLVVGVDSTAVNGRDKLLMSFGEDASVRAKLLVNHLGVFPVPFLAERMANQVIVNVLRRSIYHYFAAQVHECSHFLTLDGLKCTLLASVGVVSQHLHLLVLNYILQNCVAQGVLPARIQAFVKQCVRLVPIKDVADRLGVLEEHGAVLDLRGG